VTMTAPSFFFQIAIFGCILLRSVDACVPMGGEHAYRVPDPRSHALVCEEATIRTTHRSQTTFNAEQEFLKVPNASRARDHLRHITSRPHVAGTEGDREMAEYVRDELQSYGITDVSLESVAASLAYPVSRSLRLYDNDGSLLFEAQLSEPILDSDRTSDTWWRNHTFGGYSPNGRATAPLVYANYGRPEDFGMLEDMGVNVQGAIVLVRYGECFRGLKVMNAEQRGAIGALIYSDPQQDGYVQGKEYPEGPWRPKESVQRGSMQYLSLCAGDPGRPYLANGSEPVCGFNMSQLIPSIPVIPISWGDAFPLLESLVGTMKAPASFQGALNLSYSTGPSHSTKVEMQVNNDFKTVPIWNVIARIPSLDEGKPGYVPRPLIVGNHRDAWVYGAADPNSGTAQMLEVARGLGVLLGKGWLPKRSIYIASWDGEEYGLLGSTAWAEMNAEMLSNATAYLNVDTGVSGTKFNAAGTTTLASLLAQVLSEIDDPYQGKPLIDLWDQNLLTLGSGSDYTAFIDHLGIASLDIRFVPDTGARYGVYHSVYDSFDWMDKQGDPGFKYHQTMAKVWGLLTLRLADASGRLPFNHTSQADAMHEYVHILEHEAEVSKAPKGLLVPLKAAVTLFEIAARSVGAYDIDHHTLDDRLAFTERRFLSESGLPHRKWFKHVLQAPGLYKGYGSDVFPGVIHELREKNFDGAFQQVKVAAKRVSAAAAYLSGLAV